ncbi:DUF6879 family protein [Streptomyces sp. TLI_171]|uniref:DUF6879 family protein n=1 Tax=Streptomyces sp. TLI_171 TaxID=1938859 RepID=UPI001C7D48A8|nr:DUF6879 family protein [Streptomyces sp. TLI_171]
MTQEASAPPPVRIPPIVRKILVSLAGGGIAYLLTNATEQPQSITLILSSFVGGTLLMVQFLVDFERRLLSVEGALVSGLAGVSEASRQMRQLRSSRLDAATVTRLLNRTAEVGHDGPTVMYAFLEQEIRRLTELVRDLSGGETAYDGEDRDWLLSLTAVAVGSIDATSAAADSEFWDSELGLRYLALQGEAVSRGVTVRRVFILDSEDPAALREVEHVCRQQAAAGIVVRVMRSSGLAASSRVDPMFDFILFDQTLSYEVSSARALDQGGRLAIANTRLVVRPERVERRIRRFEELWSAAGPPAP